MTLRQYFKKLLTKNLWLSEIISIFAYTMAEKHWKNVMYNQNYSNDMKKVLLLMTMAMMSIGVSAQSDDETSKNGLDTLVVSKVVRWNANAGPGEVEASYGCSVNNYGAPPKTSLSSRSTSRAAAATDSLALFITDTEKEMQIATDTAYFFHAVDPNDEAFKDSLFITRFTQYLDTNRETNDSYSLSLKALMGGTLKIYAAPRKKTDENVEITVKQNGTTIMQGNVASTTAPSDTISINISAFNNTEIMGYVMSYGTNNYNLTNPPSSSGGIGGGSSSPTKISYYRPLMSPKPIGPGELTIEYPKAVRIYGVELVQILGHEENNPALVEYPGNEYLKKHGVSNEFVKLKNDSTISCIEFADDYTATDNYLEIIPPAGFKKNDVVRIAGVYSTEGNSNAQLDLFQIIGDTPDIVLTTNPLVNAKSIATTPAYESIILSRGYDKLFIGRTKGSTANPMLTNLRVEGERTYEEITGIKERVVKFEIDFTKPFYNLQGQRVDDNYKGIVIQNGVKIIRR